MKEEKMMKEEVQEEEKKRRREEEKEEKKRKKRKKEKRKKEKRKKELGTNNNKLLSRFRDLTTCSCFMFQPKNVTRIIEGRGGMQWRRGKKLKVLRKETTSFVFDVIEPEREMFYELTCQWWFLHESYVGQLLLQWAEQVR